MKRKSPPRMAFTLIELLVVIAVIGVLVALLLPAVQAARESARRTQCKNNLKQLGIAVHMYHDVQRGLPSGWVADPIVGDPGWSWGAMTLPFVEQGNLHRLVNFDLHVDDEANERVRTKRLPLFLCPSDPEYLIGTFTLEEEAHPGGHFQPPGDHGQFPLRLAFGNYVGMFGSNEIEDDPDHGNGAFFQNSHVRFGDIHDGLSNTILFGERCSRLGFSTWVGMVHGGERAMARVVGSADHPPNHHSAHFDDFASFHPTGAQFGFGDGSVQLITTDVEPELYRALATRAVGEPLSLK